MPNFVIQLSCSTQEELDTLLRNGLGVTALRLANEPNSDLVFRLNDITNMERYVVGPKIERTGTKRAPRNSLSQRPRKKPRPAAVPKDEIRGALGERKSQLHAQSYARNTTAVFRPLREQKDQARLLELEEALETCRAKEVELEATVDAQTCSIERQAARIQNLQRRSSNLEEEVARLVLEGRAESCEPAETTFRDENGRYDPDIELLMMEMVMSTSYSKAWPLTKLVYESTTGNTCQDSPSLSWLQNLVKRANILCDMQIALVLLQHKGSGVTVLHDGTQYHGQIIQGSQFVINDTIISLGVQEVEDGTAVSSFNSFKRRLVQVLATLTEEDKMDKVMNEILLKLAASLSDRCAVEIKWAGLLEEQRFAAIQQEHANMPEPEQRAKAVIYKYFCMAHCLSGMTEELDKLFVEERKELPSNCLYTKTAFHAVRELSKSFHPKSSWGFQLFQHYLDYCVSHGFVGHEFLSSIGRCVGSRNHNQLVLGLKAILAKESLLEFLDFWEGRKTTAQPNRMFAANKRALKCPQTLFELESMGLVHTLLVGPMLSVMAGHLGGVKHNLDLVLVVDQLLLALQNPDEQALLRMVRGEQPLISLFARPRAQFLAGTCRLPKKFEDIVDGFLDSQDAARRREVFEGFEAARFSTLRRVWAEDVTERETKHVQLLLKLFPRMAQKLQQRQPELCPQGAYHNLSADDKKAAPQAPTTSDSQEGDFGIYDRRKHLAPNMLVETTSTHIQVQRNNMFAWMRSLPEEMRHSLVRVARVLARQRERENKQRRAQLRVHRIIKAHEESKSAAIANARRGDAVEDALRLVWRSTDQMTQARKMAGGSAFRAESGQRAVLSPQFTYMQALGVWSKPKKFAVSTTAIAVLVSLMEGLIAKLAESTADLEAKADELKAQHADAELKARVPEPDTHSDSDDDEDVSYIMPCCRVEWAEGLACVACSWCQEWYHIAALGECNGVGITLKDAKKKSFKYYCVSVACQAAKPPAHVKS